MRVVRLIALGLAAFGMATAAAAQSADSHQAGQFASVVARSAFLHGYLHGYEAGYHDGNIDFQLARGADPSRYAKADSGYHDAFGDRRIFEEGFRQGLRVAYADGYFGRSFRAIQSLHQVEPELASGLAAQLLDRAIADGYDSGLTRGLTDGRRGAPFVDVSSACDRSDVAYCNVFTGGYRLGYSDGYLNQRSDPVRPPAATIASSATGNSQ